MLFMVISKLESDLERQSNAYPGEENTPRLDMQIHQIKCDTTLQISTYMRYSHLPSYVRNFQITQPRLRFVTNSLIDLFVLLDAPQKVAFCIFTRHVCVVGVAGRDFERDIGVDDRLIFADRLEEYNA